MDEIEIKKAVRERYAGAVTEKTSCCGEGSSCCGSGSGIVTAEELSRGIGYSDAEMGSVPEGANLGLGCGNPVALASLAEGETVVDLGSGAGFDCFLASMKVGPTGKVIGVDMTPEMIAAARENAKKNDYKNVEFRLGEIENLPVADDTADIIISNCVINLAPDKGRVFREAFRALKPGGRLMVSDIVVKEQLPPPVMASVAAYVSCVGGASLLDDYLATLRAAGFGDVKVVQESAFGMDSVVNDPQAMGMAAELGLSREELERTVAAVVSVRVAAVKPS